MINTATFQPPHQFTKLLASQTLQVLNQIQYHDVWCAACVLHPGLLSFNFCSREIAKSCRSIGENLVRRMISDSNNKSTENDDSCTVGGQSTQAITSVTGDLGQTAWNLSNKMSFLTSKKADVDEVSKYLNMALSHSEIEVPKKDDGIIDFWLSQSNNFPNLHKHAIRLHTTPATSTPQRTRL